MRILDAAWLAVGLVHRAGLIAQNAGDETDHRIDYHHRGDFASVADKVPDRNRAWTEELADAVVGVDQLSAFDVDWKYTADIAAGGAAAALLKCVAKSVRASRA